MRDWYLDPPEEPEPPECEACDEGFGDYLYDGETDKGEPTQVYSCDHCGYQWSILIDPDWDVPQEIQVTDEELEEMTKPHATHCPHGKKWGECDYCDHLGDLAFDAARENRFMRRR